ncbi:diguanylate cyclase domain-containing protein [Anaerotignum lactatifermentans]
MGTRVDALIKWILGAKISHEDFVEKSVSSNQIALRIGTAFGVLFELCNIYRVLFFRDIMVNRLIYLRFYLVYLACCVVFLIVDFCFKMSDMVRHRFYMISVGMILFWHLLFNMHNVYLSGAMAYFTIVTAIFFFSGFLMFKPLYTITSLGICYITYILFINPIFSVGEIVNFSVTISLCILMYLIRYKHLRIEVCQAKQMQEVQQELTDAQQDFRLTIEQYELIREQESSITFEWDIQEDWIRFSKEWRHYFDHPENISQFYDFVENMDLLSSSHKEILLTCMENIKKGVAYQKYEFMLPVKSGESRWFEIRVITQTNKQGEPVLGIGILSDITERKDRISQLEKEIQMDMFTGLLNKASIERYGKRKLSELREGEKLAALIVDMDDFKDINDRYGHPAGDHVLKETADILRHHAPVGARIGRIGGDEFMVLLIGCNISCMETYAEEVISKILRIHWNGIEVSPSCSMGLAVASTPNVSYDELYRKADEALYHAKQLGKNRLYTTFSEQTENN